MCKMLTHCHLYMHVQNVHSLSSVYACAKCSLTVICICMCKMLTRCHLCMCVQNIHSLSSVYVCTKHSPSVICVCMYKTFTHCHLCMCVQNIHSLSSVYACTKHSLTVICVFHKSLLSQVDKSGSSHTPLPLQSRRATPISASTCILCI